MIQGLSTATKVEDSDDDTNVLGRARTKECGIPSYLVVKRAWKMSKFSDSPHFGDQADDASGATAHDDDTMTTSYCIRSPLLPLFLLCKYADSV